MLKCLSNLLKRLSILSHLRTVRKMFGKIFENCDDSRQSMSKDHLVSSRMVSDLLQLSTHHLIDRAEGCLLGGARMLVALQPVTCG